MNLTHLLLYTAVTSSVLVIHPPLQKVKGNSLKHTVKCVYHKPFDNIIPRLCGKNAGPLYSHNLLKKK